MSGTFSVVAIVSTYNEADILGQVLDHLAGQGIKSYVLDDSSTDDTLEIALRRLGGGVIGVERLETHSQDFNWEGILARKEQLAQELNADWYIHQDADEFRESPWLNMTLLNAIRRVDALGFNAIDFVCLNFRPTDDSASDSDDIRTAIPFYEEAAEYDRVQIRCWKRTESPVRLAPTGGHEAEFPERRVFPIRFLLRHYPIRSQSHGERKVFKERRPRFLTKELARGWHVQYNDIEQSSSFVRNPATLTLYDADAVRVSLVLRNRNVEDLETSLAASRLALDRQRDGLEDQQRQLVTHLREMDEHVLALRRELRDVRLAASQHRRDAESLRLSRSWRWTAPARMLYSSVTSVAKRWMV